MLGPDLQIVGLGLGCMSSPLPLPTSLSFAPNQRKIYRRRCSNDGYTAQEYTVSFMVQRRIRRRERERSHDGANVSKPYHPAGADTALPVAREIHREPADYDRHGRIRTHGHEEDGTILQRRVVMHGDEDGAARDGEGEGEGDKGGASLQSVG